MPSVIWEDDVFDSGTSILGGTRVFYVAWEITILGPNVRHPSVWDNGTIVGGGFWQLGNDLTSLGLISGIGWSEPHWLHSQIGQWIAPPGIVGTEFSAAIQQYIQWIVSPGTLVHMYVFGDA